MFKGWEQLGKDMGTKGQVVSEDARFEVGGSRARGYYQVEYGGQEARVELKHF